MFAGPDLLAVLQLEGIVHAHVDDFNDASLAGAGDGERIALREAAIADVVVDVGELFLHAGIQSANDVVLVVLTKRAVLEVDDEVGLAVLLSRGDHGGKQVLDVLLSFVGDLVREDGLAVLEGDLAVDTVLHVDGAGLVDIAEDVAGDPVDAVLVGDDKSLGLFPVVLIAGHRRGGVRDDDTVLVVVALFIFAVFVLFEDAAVCIGNGHHTIGLTLQGRSLQDFIHAVEQGVVDAAVFSVAAAKADRDDRKTDGAGDVDAPAGMCLTEPGVDETLFTGGAAFTDCHHGEKPGHLAAAESLLDEVLTCRLQEEVGSGQTEVRFADDEVLQEVVSVVFRLKSNGPALEQGVGDHGDEVRIGVRVDEGQTTEVLSGGVAAEFRVMEDTDRDEGTVPVHFTLRETDAGGTGGIGDEELGVEAIVIDDLALELRGLVEELEPRHVGLLVLRDIIDGLVFVVVVLVEVFFVVFALGQVFRQVVRQRDDDDLLDFGLLDDVGDLAVLVIGDEEDFVRGLLQDDIDEFRVIVTAEAVELRADLVRAKHQKTDRGNVGKAAGDLIAFFHAEREERFRDLVRDLECLFPADDVAAVEEHFMFRFLLHPALFDAAVPGTVVLFFDLLETDVTVLAPLGAEHAVGRQLFTTLEEVLHLFDMVDFEALIGFVKDVELFDSVPHKLFLHTFDYSRGRLFIQLLLYHTL